MTVVAKISAKSGKVVRTVALRKGLNALRVDADSVVTVIDEATGLPVEGAQMVRHGSEVSIQFDPAQLAGGDGAAGAMLAEAGEGNQPATSGAASDASAAAGAGSGGGGGSGLALGLLGVAGLGGLVAAAAGGGKGEETRDTSPPAAPTGLALAAADDSGSSNTDRITSQTNGLTITGTAEANATVTILEGSTTLGTGTANGTGQFSIDIALGAGDHTLTATAKDAAGNTSSASSSLAVRVDTTAPAAPSVPDLAAADDQGSSTTDNLTNQTSALTLTGTAEAGATVTLRDGSTVLASTTATGGTYSFDVTLAPGTDPHNLSVIATDAAGNVSLPSAALAVTVDTTAPTVQVTADRAVILAGETATLTFTFSEAPAPGTFTLEDILVTGGTPGSLVQSSTDNKIFTAVLTPDDAPQIIPITVEVRSGAVFDMAGNASPASSSLALSFDPGGDGAVADGYISGALVFRDGSNGFAANGQWDHEAFVDANANGIRDDGESFTDSNSDGTFTAEYARVTDAQGNFDNLFGTGRIIMTGLPGSIDISTGLAFTGTYSAPDGATVVNPLTTIVDALTRSGVSLADAQSQVKAALGLPADAVLDLTTFDPLLASTDAATGDLAVEVQKAAAQVANVLAVVAGAATGAGATDGGAAAMTAAADAIADQVQSGTVNLSDSATVMQVVTSVADATGGTVGDALTGQVEALSSALASVNDAVQQASGDNVSDVLTAVAAAQIVAQETLAADAAGGTLDPADYSGSALAEKIDTAATEVETIVPQAEGPVGDPDRPMVDGTFGTRISQAEAASGVPITVSYLASDNVVAGDTLRLLVGGVAVQSYTLTAADIPAEGAIGSHVFTLTAADLGSDGAKAVTAQFVQADDTAGPQSYPLLLTLDTATVTPIVNTVSGGFINAVEAVAGVSGTLGAIEVGSTTSVAVSGTSAANPALTTSINFPGTGKDYVLTPDMLAQFADGTLTITALQTDANGNVSTIGSGTVVLDRTIGPVSGPVLLVDDDSAVQADGLTNLTSGITFVGTADAGAVVTLRDGATVIGSGVANAAGQYSIDVTLAEGDHSITATAVDAAGNAATGTEPYALRIDATAPGTPSGLALDAVDDTGASSSDGVTSRTNALTITGSAEAAAQVLLMDGATVLGTTTADSNGRFSLDVSLAAGVHAITASALDAAGNRSADSLPLALTVDVATPAAPTLLQLSSADDTGVSQVDGVTSLTSGLTVTGNAPAGTTVTLLEGTSVLGIGTVNASGQFAIDIALADGPHEIYATATNLAGTTSLPSGPIAITVDAAGPATPAVLQLDGVDDTGVSGADGITSRTTGLTITGTATAGSLVALSDGAVVLGEVVAGQDGRFSMDITLAEGAHLVRAVATDLAGNTSATSEPLAITVDATAPSAPAALALAAADDTGASSSDGITRLATGLAITGSAEAGSLVTLRNGTDVVGTTTANASGQFSLELALAEGVHAITATATDAAGNVGPASAVLTVRVDTTAPSAPTIVASEGPILQAVAAADGTRFAGTTEAGSTVSVVFSNGEQAITRAAVVVGTDFTVDLSAAELATLGEGFIRYTAVATDVAGNAGAASLTGQLYYTLQPIIEPTPLDTISTIHAFHEGSNVAIAPLANGGSVVSWTVDGDFDGNGDTIAFQRISADGTRIGEPVVLSNLPAGLTSQGAQINSYEFTPLANGSFVLAYELDRPTHPYSTAMGYVTTGSATLFSTYPLLGIPQELHVGNAPANVSFVLRGMGNNGSSLDVAVTADADGHILVTKAILDQFQFDDRLTLVANGIQPGQVFGVGITVQENRVYDPDGTVTTLSVSSTAITLGTLPSGASIGAGGLVSPTGRATAFHLDAFQAVAGATLTATMTIFVAPGYPPLDITGLSNATRLANGAIRVTFAVTAAGGDFAVPASILAQLGDHDAAITLGVAGVVPGTTVSGTVSQLAPSFIPQGVFTQAFDANGVAVGSPVALETEATGHAVLNGEGIGITALASGGYVVNWVVDADGDGEGEALAIQKFAPDGSANGAPFLLSGVSGQLLGNVENIGSVEIDALADGKIALAWSLTPQVLQQNGTVITPPLTVTSGAAFSMLGKPLGIDVVNAAGATFQLRGRGLDGSVLEVGVTAVDGHIAIDPAVLAQFADPTRLALLIQGLPPGVQVNVSARVEQLVHYDTEAALVTNAVTGVNSNGAGILAAPVGRAEAFHLDAAVGTPTGALMLIRTLTPSPFNLSGLPGVNSTRVLSDGTIELAFAVNPSGDYAVPPTLLDHIGSLDAAIFMVFLGLSPTATVTGTISVNQPIANAVGVYSQLFDSSGQALGEASARLDDAGTLVSGSDEGRIGITPLVSGGHAVFWVVDADGDSAPDGIAVQRFAADGTRQGDIVMLQGLDLAIDSLGELLGSYDVQALANGGYELAYTVDLPLTITDQTAVSSPSGTVSFALSAGVPRELYIYGTEPQAVYTLQGLGEDGNPHPVIITRAADGRLEISADILSGYADPSRLSLLVSNLTPGTLQSTATGGMQAVGTTLTLSGTLMVNDFVDPGSVAHVEAARSTIVSGSVGITSGAVIGVLSTDTGRAEAFHIEQVTYNPANPGLKLFLLQIVTERVPGTYDLSGIAGAQVTSTGAIQLTVSPDANNTIAVPQALLTQLGIEDAHISLIGLNLAPGSAFSGSVTVRDTIEIPFGVYAQTFDANGVPLSADLTLDGTTGADRLEGGSGNDTLISNGVIDGVVDGFASTEPVGGGLALPNPLGDVLLGGAGDDEIILNAPITLGTIIDGGTGRDALYLAAQSGTSVPTSGPGPVPPPPSSLVRLVNATVSGIETIVFGSQAGLGNFTVLTGAGQFSAPLTLQGGAGTDVFVISTTLAPSALVPGGTLPSTGGGVFTLPDLQVTNWSVGDVVVFTAAGSTADTTLNAGRHVGTQMLMIGGSGNDTLNGADGVELMQGGAGNDTLNGLGGNDTLNSGGGMDTLRGGAGNDRLIADGEIVAGTVFDGGDDTDTLQLGTGAITFVPPAGTGIYVPLFNASLTGIENIQFASASGGVMQVLVGPGQLASGMTITGGVGQDILIVTTGAEGGSFSFPALNFANWGAGDLVVFTAMGQGDSTLQIGDHSVFVMVNGGAGNDTLMGGNSADTLNGGDGNDVLIGGGGRDMLSGGEGADLFVLDAPNGQVLTLADVISDFAVGTDHLQLGGGIGFADVSVVAGDSGSYGGSSSEALVVYTASGDVLARLTNVEAAAITAASFA